MKEYGFQLSVVDDVSKQMKSMQKSIDAMAEAVKGATSSLNVLPNSLDTAERAAERGRRSTSSWLKETLSFNRTLKQTTALIGASFGLNSIVSFTGDMIKAEQQISSSFGIAGTELQTLTADVQRLATTYGVDMSEAITSAQTLSAKFGIEAQASLRLMNTALSKGVSPNFLSDVESMSANLAAAGMKAEDMVATLALAERAGAKDEIVGIFEETKKSLDLLGTKKGGEASAALSAIGLNPKTLKRDLDAGTITVSDAVRQIAGKLAIMEPSSKKASEAMNALFGKESSESMQRAAQILGGTPNTLDDLANRTTRASAAQQSLLGAWAEFKIYLAETVLPVFADIVDWVKANQEAIISWGSAILQVGGAVLGIWAAYKAGAALSAIITGMSAAWGFLTGVLGIATGAQTAFNIAATLNPLGLVVAAIAAISVAVYGLVTYWEDVKIWLWEAADMLWKFNPLSWLTNIIENVFPGFKQALSDWYDSTIAYFGAAYDWLNANFFEPFSSAFDGWADWATFGLWSEAWAAYDELDAAYAEQAAKNKMTEEDWTKFHEATGGQYDWFNKEAQATTEAAAGLPSTPIGGGKSAPMLGAGGLGKSKNIGVSAGIAEVRGDARQMKNITINIDKLIDAFTVTTNSFSESPSKIKDEVVKAILMASNDANNIQ